MTITLNGMKYRLDYDGNVEMYIGKVWHLLPEVAAKTIRTIYATAIIQRGKAVLQ